MNREAVPAVACALECGVPCPEECLRRGVCAVIRIRQVDGTARWGVPVAVVGETLRFRQALPVQGMLLLPLRGLDPESVLLAVSRAERT